MSTPSFAVAARVGLFSAFLSLSATCFAQQAIETSRNPIAPGEKVVLRWYFKAHKILLSGGRFGKGANVTGKTSVTDSPAKTTTYTFDVTLAPAKGDKPPVKTRYTAVVRVLNPNALGMTTYQNRYGWRVMYVKGWRSDVVPNIGDPSSNALVYFQPEMDSLERLAVAILPVTEASSAALLEKVKKDLYNTYDGAEVLETEEVTHDGAPGHLMMFAGGPNTHPGKRTQSIVLVFVRNGKGYVISSRTLASRFELRKPLMEAMVKSFTSLIPAASASR